MEPLDIYVTGLDREAEASLLGGLGDLRIQKVSEPPTRPGPDGRPGLAVVGLNGHANEAFDFVSRLTAAGTRVAVVGPSHDADLILRAMRAGAREFAVANEPKNIVAAVRSLVRPGTGLASGALTAVFPAKGGMGATTIAANLAAAMAASGPRACLVDLDLQLGDVPGFLDVHGGYTISDVIANMRRLDRELLDASVISHRSGVRILAQAERIEEAEQVDADAVGKLLGFLRQHYDQVVVDGIRGFDELSLAALDAADRVLMVVTQEVPAVRNAQRCAAIFRKLKYREDKVALVVNRFLKSSNITTTVIEETVGLPVVATMANDFASASQAIQRGGTVLETTPRSILARDFGRLTKLVAGDAGVKQGGGVLKRLFGGR